MLLTNHVEPHLPGRYCVPVAWLLRELDAVIREYGVDAIGDRLEQKLEKLRRCLAMCFGDQLRGRKLARPIIADEEIELALHGLNLGDIDVNVADWVALELLALRFVAIDIWKTRDSMSFKTRVEPRDLPLGTTLSTLRIGSVSREHTDPRFPYGR